MSGLPYPLYLSKFYIYSRKGIIYKNLENFNFITKSTFVMRITSDKHILNFYNNCLSDTDKMVLSRGLDFRILLKNIDKVESFCEFEMLYSQLKKKTAHFH